MKRKIYEPVREFERQTSYCPLYLAWRIVDEARNYFRTPIPEAFAVKLARRAEAVFAKHALSSMQWRRGNGKGGASKFAPRSGSLPVGRGESERLWLRRFRNRECILAFMRHWLASVLAKENPVLFRQLPESFKIGLELPEKPRSSGRASTPSNQNRLTSAATVPRPDSRSLGRRPPSSPHHPAHRFVHGCGLLLTS